MISGLLLHLREDTLGKEGVVYAYKETGIPNIYVNENGIEASRELITAKRPQVIVIQDEPDFMELAEAVGGLSPESLNIIDRSVYVGTGIKIRKRDDYDRLRELGFAIYRSGYDLNKLCGILGKYNNGKFKRTFRQKISRSEPFEALKKAVREEFEYNYRFI